MGEEDVQVAEGVEPVAEEMTPDEARRAEKLSRRRMAYSFPQFFCLLNLGLILTAVALVLFKTPNHLAFGGTTGFAILLNTALPALPVSAYMWILNAVLVLLGLVFLERKAVLWSAFASFALSGYTSLFEWLFPVTTSITGDLWLDVCFAVLLPAVGSALVFDIGASTGGTDILAMILRKRTDLEIGKALFAVDVAVVVAAIGLYGRAWASTACSRSSARPLWWTASSSPSASARSARSSATTRATWRSSSSRSSAARPR